jgi:hypothetical protein
VFNTPSANIPAYNSAGNQTFPDFSQASIFENPVGKYAVKKEAPQFGDTLTKVWGPHTIKVGGFTQTTDNYQSSFSYDEDGIMSFSAGQHPDLINTGNGTIGSPQNAVSQFVNGILSSYTENNSAPIGDVVQQSTAGFIDDTWKASRRLTLELGIRIEHVGHWYDRDHIGLAVFYPNRVLSDYYSGKSAPGYYWHAIDAGVPLSGQPNRFAYPDARFGFSYDLLGHGDTVIRGGWGVYRYVTQVNTVANGEAQGTAASVLQYNQPGSTLLQMQNVKNAAYVPCPSATVAPPCSKLPNIGTFSGSQTGLDASDYGQPMTQAYNVTIDQKLPWNSQLDVAYVGSMTSQLVDGGEDISGSSYTELTNMNKAPIGALFAPDPRTGILSTNPENVSENPNGAGETATGNVNADYHPYGFAYGTAQAYELENTAYANYNGLQVAWVKTTGRLTFNLNGTWSKMLGTTIQQDPYHEAGNYGPTAEDRPFVFNESYAYNSGTLHTGNNVLNALGGGWTITGISTWQKGSYIPAVGSVNFGFGAQYTGLPATAKANGIGTNLGDPTYFGTDESIPIRPVLTCNPNNGLGTHQVLNGACFAAPAIAGGTTVSKNGGFAWPYMSQTPYFSNDLALYRSFHIYEKQQVQFRISAFDWLNHSLLTFNGSTPTTVNYNVDYASKTITPNFNGPGAPVFGVMTVRSALPYARVMELDVKYSF